VAQELRKGMTPAPPGATTPEGETDMRYRVTGQMASHTIESEAGFSNIHDARMWFEMIADVDAHARIIMWDTESNELLDTYTRGQDWLHRPS